MNVIMSPNIFAIVSILAVRKFIRSSKAACEPAAAPVPALVAMAGLCAFTCPDRPCPMTFTVRRGVVVEFGGFPWLVMEISAQA